MAASSVDRFIPGTEMDCSVATKEIILRLLDDFENTSKELIDNIAAVAAQRGPKNDLIQTVSETVEKLISKDHEIQSAVKVAEQQILIQQQIVQIRDEISRKDQDILLLQSQLRDAEQILANALFEAKKKLNATKEANNAAVSSEDLIKFAFRISSSNAVEAPPDWQPGDPRRPYPLDFVMRSGILGQLSQQSHSGILSDDELGKSRHSSVVDEQATMKPGANEPQKATYNIAQASNANTWSVSDQANDVYQQIVENKEQQPYAMVSANAIQPQNIFNGEKRPSDADEIEFMSSSSDSSSSDSP